MGKYNFEIDPAVRNGHTVVADFVGRGATVLEVGCATGYMTKYLSEEFGCTVDCIDIDAASVALAAQYARKSVVADIEAFDFSSLDAKYDVVVYADVLEHLREPREVLVRTRKCLKDGGLVVASIPNVTHASVVWEMINGEFQYRELGLLDNTHIRFFSRSTVKQMFEGAGFHVRELDVITVEPEHTEFNTAEPDMIRRIMEHRNLDWTTYQFVVQAVVDFEHSVEEDVRLHPLSSGTSVVTFESLNQRIEKLQTQNEELRGQLESCNSLLRSRSVALTEASDEIRTVQREAVFLEGENAYLRMTLEQVQHDLNWLRSRTVVRLRLGSGRLFKRLIKKFIGTQE